MRPIRDKFGKFIKGHSFTKQMIQKMSEVKKGKYHTEETRKKMSLAHMGNKIMLGRKLSAETKRKIGLASKGNKYALGRKQSEEEKRRRSKANKKYYQTHKHWHKEFKHSEEYKRKMSKTKKGTYRGLRNANWRGGRIKTPRGYILVYKPNHPFCTTRGYIFEQRLVVEKQIGRYLKFSEKCHHLGKKDDNRPRMLMAFINHSAHMKFHRSPQKVKSSEIIFDGRKI